MTLTTTVSQHSMIHSTESQSSHHLSLIRSVQWTEFYFQLRGVECSHYK